MFNHCHKCGKFVWFKMFHRCRKTISVTEHDPQEWVDRVLNQKNDSDEGLAPLVPRCIHDVPISKGCGLCEIDNEKRLRSPPAQSTRFPSRSSQSRRTVVEDDSEDYPVSDAATLLVVEQLFESNSISARDNIPSDPDPIISGGGEFSGGGASSSWSDSSSSSSDSSSTSCDSSSSDSGSSSCDSGGGSDGGGGGGGD